MKPEASPPPALASLLSRLMDGRALSETELAKLEEILRHSPAAREYYHDYLATHLDLTEAVPQMHFVPTVQPGWFRRARIPLAIAALLPIAVGLALWAPWRDAGPQPALVLAAPHVGPVLAISARTKDLAWSLPLSPTPGQKLTAGPVKLSTGVLALDLVGGQTLTIQSPAEFELIDENEMFLTSGAASLRMDRPEKTPFIIRVARGAVVDLGTEFSIKTLPNGMADVWVFEGKAMASISGGKDNPTRAGMELVAGQSIRLADDFAPSPVAAVEFVRQLAGDEIPDSPAGDSYARAVTASLPAAWWRFEQGGPGQPVPDESGGQALNLHGTPKIAGAMPGRHFLYTDQGGHSGFAMPAGGLDGLDTARGLTIEFLCHSSREDYGSIIALELFGKDYSQVARKNGFNHAPARAVLERMGRKGAHIGHVHPDYAIRGLLRSPASYIYQAGANAYSSQAYLLHRWIHVALTRDGNQIRLFIDGELSSEVGIKDQFEGDRLRPIIGRLQPDPRDEKRQWIGGIDEVALYPRALSPEEVRRHAEALIK